MQAPDADHFDREMGCTEDEWLRWLPQAAGSHPVQIDPAERRAEIVIGAGRCRLAWRTLPDRRIALMCIPRLAVSFRFEAVGADDRNRFMRYFDLHTQRGGG